MGTRNLTMVYLDGEYKVAQYGQWDGYPEGQGITTLCFVRDKMKENLFRARCRSSKFINTDEYNELLSHFCPNDKRWLTTEDTKEFYYAYPQFSRDTGAEIFELIQSSSSGIPLRDDISFIADSVFCEWAWLIDLDNRRLEAYQGFNSSSLSESDRFFEFESRSKEEYPDGEYHPCKLVCSWSLDNLPTNEEFLSSFSEDEE